MTRRETFLALAAKVEAAQGAEEHVVIAEVVVALGRRDLIPLIAAGGALAVAESLVPEGRGWKVGFPQPSPGRPWAEVFQGNARHHANGATPALALTAAALRARAEEAGG